MQTQSAFEKAIEEYRGLQPEIGKAITRGEEVEIQQNHLIRVMNGRGFTAGYKKCRQCGYETAEDFDFCPKCGMRF